MNKLLSLTNLELKRSSRFYIVYISLFSFLTLSLNIAQMIRLKKLPQRYTEIIDAIGGISYGSAIITINNLLYSIIEIGLFGILMYSIYIWQREYSGTNKSIYTLITLPQDRFNIYLSKMLATMIMVYSFLVSQIFILFISKNIFNILFKDMNILKTSLANDICYNSDLLYLIPINITDFIINYGLNLILIISIIFTSYMIIITIKNYKKRKQIVVALLVLIIMYLYIYNMYAYKGLFLLIDLNITKLGIYIILNLITTIILNIISYVLINKKLYI